MASVGEIHCKAEDLGQAIELIVREYGEAVTETTAEVIKRAGQIALEKVTELSPRKTGDYAENWVLTTNPKDAEVAITGKSAGFARVYNRRYHLTHLLEKGHAMRQGGRARAIPHIAPAQTYTEEWLDRELTKKLTEAT